MAKKGLGLLLAAAAAYGYYRYRKLSPEQKAKLKASGKKIINGDFEPLTDLFSEKKQNTGKAV